MKTMVILVLGTLLVGGNVTAATASAADDLEFATPVVSEATPVRAAGNHAVATESIIFRRWPVMKWFQERRTARGAARPASRRCCD